MSLASCTTVGAVIGVAAAFVTTKGQMRTRGNTIDTASAISKAIVIASRSLLLLRGGWDTVRTKSAFSSRLGGVATVAAACSGGLLTLALI